MGDGEQNKSSEEEICPMLIASISSHLSRHRSDDEDRVNMVYHALSALWTKMSKGFCATEQGVQISAVCRETNKNTTLIAHNLQGLAHLLIYAIFDWGLARVSFPDGSTFAVDHSVFKKK